MTVAVGPRVVSRAAHADARSSIRRPHGSLGPNLSGSAHGPALPRRGVAVLALDAHRTDPAAAARAGVGSRILLPQIPNSPDRVARYLTDHPVVGELFWRLGLFDVFGSWWFALITILLFVSLIACLLPRSRAMVRTLRQRPVQARELDGFRHVAVLTVPGEPDAAVVTARRVLARRFYRVEAAADGQALAADKGALREIGSLVFHWAFVLLLLGVVVGKGFGYSGRATIAEGQTWTDAAANYDPLSLRAGRFFAGEHTGVGVRLVSFRNDFRASGVPMDFVSAIQVLDPDGNVVRDEDVRVNHPAEYGGIRIFQFGFGWAPVVTVDDDGEAIADGPIVMGQATAPQGVSQLAMPWRGFVKLPGLRPQVAVQLELWPDSEAYVRSIETGMPQPMVGENAPFMRYTVWSGRLLDPSLAELDTRFMEEVGSGVIGAGQTVDLGHRCVVDAPGEEPGASSCPAGTTTRLTMSFPDLVHYSVLQVTKDVGVPIVLAAAILLLMGLLPALYTSRRKLWVRAEPAEHGTTLLIGGFALQRKPQFEEEFASVVAAIAEAAGGTSASTREMVGAR